MDKIRTLGGLEVRDRSYHLRTYRSCFVGESVVLTALSVTGVLEQLYSEHKHNSAGLVNSFM